MCFSSLKAGWISAAGWRHLDDCFAQHEGFKSVQVSTLKAFTFLFSYRVAPIIPLKASCAVWLVCNVYPVQSRWPSVLWLAHIWRQLEWGSWWRRRERVSCVTVTCFFFFFLSPSLSSHKQRNRAHKALNPVNLSFVPGPACSKADGVQLSIFNNASPLACSLKHPTVWTSIKCLLFALNVTINWSPNSVRLCLVSYFLSILAPLPQPMSHQLVNVVKKMQNRDGKMPFGRHRSRCCATTAARHLDVGHRYLTFAKTKSTRWAVSHQPAQDPCEWCRSSSQKTSNTVECTASVGGLMLTPKMIDVLTK